MQFLKFEVGAEQILGWKSAIFGFVKNIEISRFSVEGRNDPIQYISCCRISGISIYLFFSFYFHRDRLRIIERVLPDFSGSSLWTYVITRAQHTHWILHNIVSTFCYNTTKCFLWQTELGSNVFFHYHFFFFLSICIQYNVGIGNNYIIT